MKRKALRAYVVFHKHSTNFLFFTTMAQTQKNHFPILWKMTDALFQTHFNYAIIANNEMFHILNLNRDYRRHGPSVV